jgi:hypothetical protein
VDKEGTIFNDIAYEMANADLNLPLALDYGRKAVRRVEAIYRVQVTSGLGLDQIKIETDAARENFN